MGTANVIGLIAGQGRLPFLVADGAKRAGLKVICIGLADSAEPQLAEHVDVFFDGAIAHYVPSLPEWSLGIGGVALSLFLVVMVTRILPFYPRPAD